MPKLFDSVVLRLDRPAVGSPTDTGTPRMVRRGTRGVLVDQSEVQPTLWTIEFSIPDSAEMVLVEASQEQFTVCEDEPKDL